MKNQEENFRKATSEIKGMINTLTEYLERLSAIPFVYDLTEKNSPETFKVIKELSSQIECDLVSLPYCIGEDSDEDANSYNAAVRECIRRAAKTNIGK